MVAGSVLAAIGWGAVAVAAYLAFAPGAKRALLRPVVQLHGQVVLQNSMVYSIAATLIVWVFYPLLDTALRRMGRLRAS